MENSYDEPFVLDFPNGQRVEDILKKAESDYSKSEIDAKMSSKANTADVYSKTEVNTALDGKVDKVSGKGLSTNDYTNADKEKLAGIAEGAEVNEIEGIKVNNTTINPDADKAVNITIPTTAADVSALPDTTRYAAALSLTINSSTFVVTCQLKDQNGDNLGTPQTIDLPLESVVVGGSYDSQTQKVILTLQNGNTIEFSVADLVYGLQTELSETNKLNPAYINYDSTHREVSDAEKSAWNAKQNALTTAQLAAANSGITSTDVEQIETNKNNILFVNQKVGVNLVNSASGSGVRWINIEVDLPAGTYTCGFGSLTGDDSGVSQLTFYGADYAIIQPERSQISKGNNVYANNITITDTAKIIRIYAASDSTTSQNKNVAYTNLFVCKQEAWNASVGVQPYALSNAELTTKEQTNETNILLNRHYGVKNIFIPTTGSVTNPTGFTGTITLNEDNSYTINGSTGGSVYYLRLGRITMPVGTFVLYARPGDKTGISVYNDADWIDSGNDRYKTFTQPTSQNIYLRIAANQTLENYTIYPMICDLVAWNMSRDYEIGALSNAELTAKEQANENNISMLTENGGGINKFQVTATTATINGITFTVNADKTITATGSIADSTQGNAIFTLGAYTAVSGDVLSEGFTEANSKAYVYARGGSTNLATVPYKEILTDDIGVQRNYACVITAGMVGQVNITFKPMICDSDSYAKSGVYQPHALSNAELTAKEQQNENNILLYQPDLKRATSFSGTTTYSMVSDCTIEIPSGDDATVYRISAMLGQGSAGIRGIILSKTNDSSTFDTDENVLCKAEQATGLRNTLSCSDIWFNSSDNPRYVYCWVKLAVSGTGRVYTISERLG